MGQLSCRSAEHVIEQSEGRGIGRLEHRLAKPGAESGGTGKGLTSMVSAQLTRLLEVSSTASERIPGRPLFHLGLISIPCRVVGGRVGSHSIGDRFDEGRTLATAGSRRRLARHEKAGQNVVAVDPHSRHSVADSLVGDGRCPRLAAQGRRDGPLVVLDVEDARCLLDGGQVQSLVDVTLAGGPVADESDRDPSSPSHLMPLLRRRRGGRATDRDRYGSDRSLDEPGPTMYRAPPHGSDAFRVDAPIHEAAELAVLGEEPVASRGGQRRTDLGGFLASARRGRGPAVPGVGG